MKLTPSSVPTIPSKSLTLAAKPRDLTPLDPERFRLSVLIPVYNERNTIETILDRVHATQVAKEIICVREEGGPRQDGAGRQHRR